MAQPKRSKPTAAEAPKAPKASRAETRIAELYGVRVDRAKYEAQRGIWRRRECPFTRNDPTTPVPCDVSANRRPAFLDVKSGELVKRDADVRALAERYGADPLPFGICSIMARATKADAAQPWIVCPKRMLDLRSGQATLPPKLRQLLAASDDALRPGVDVRCWWEVRFQDDSDEASGAYFIYTFDYLLHAFERDADGRPHRLVGKPHIVEVMTSSTRGGGLTRHMVDALLGREQVALGRKESRPILPGADETLPLFTDPAEAKKEGEKPVKSAYSPNYRQVFERMLGQFFAKSEIAAKWGGIAVWLVQDVLIEYIARTTGFQPAQFRDRGKGEIVMLVGSMVEDGETYRLNFNDVLRGRGRPSEGGEPYFTSMLGLGHSPSIEQLYERLGADGSGYFTPKGSAPNTYRDFKWPADG